MIEIMRYGIYSSVQDLGRFDYMRFGVPISGALDQQAFKMANQLLNNSLNSAVLECSFMGPKLRFHKETYITLTGAKMESYLNKKKINNYLIYKVNEGDILSMGIALNGCRTYLGICGGIKTEKILGSRSQFKGITSETRISKKILIPIGLSNFKPEKGARVHPSNIDYTRETIEVYPGPEFDMLTKFQKDIFKNKIFHISTLNDRMAFYLEEKIESQLPQIWTAPVLPGTVQCTPDGSLIILMRDAQVTGGYPRLFQLTEGALQLLAQKTTRASLQFKFLPEIV